MTNLSASVARPRNTLSVLLLIGGVLGVVLFIVSLSEERFVITEKLNPPFLLWGEKEAYVMVGHTFLFQGGSGLARSVQALLGPYRAGSEGVLRRDMTIFHLNSSGVSFQRIIDSEFGGGYIMHGRLTVQKVSSQDWDPFYWNGERFLRWNDEEKRLRKKQVEVAQLNRKLASDSELDGFREFDDWKMKRGIEEKFEFEVAGRQYALSYRNGGHSRSELKILSYGPASSMWKVVCREVPEHPKKVARGQLFTLLGRNSAGMRHSSFLPSSLHGRFEWR